MIHENPAFRAAPSGKRDGAKVFFLLWIFVIQTVAVLPVVGVVGIALVGWVLGRYLTMMSNDPGGRMAAQIDQILVWPFSALLMVAAMIGLTGWGSALLWKRGRYGLAALLSTVPAVVIVAGGINFWLRAGGP